MFLGGGVVNVYYAFAAIAIGAACYAGGQALADNDRPRRNST